MAWLDEVHLNHAVTGHQDAGRDLNNPVEVCRITYYPNALWVVACVVPKVLCAPESARQRLAPLGNHLAVMTLHVKSAIEVVTRVSVPLFRTVRLDDERLARPHDEKLAFG